MDFWFDLIKDMIDSQGWPYTYSPDKDLIVFWPNERRSGIILQFCDNHVMVNYPYNKIISQIIEFEDPYNPKCDPQKVLNEIISIFE